MVSDNYLGEFIASEAVLSARIKKNSGQCFRYFSVVVLETNLRRTEGKCVLQKKELLEKVQQRRKL